MNKKQLVAVKVIAGLVMLLYLSGCADDTAKSAGYRGQESVEYQDWSVSQQREIIESIAQAYNKETELTSKLISNQLKTRDADIESMNERYSYSQNITSEGFPRR